MKVSKKIIALLFISMLSIPINESFANDMDNISVPVKADQITSELKSAGIKSVYNGARSIISDEYIDDYDVDTNNTVVIHNNGYPINTDIFKDKQGNELFAIAISDKNGVQTPTYYMSNSDELMNDTLDGIISDLSEDDLSKNTSEKAGRMSQQDYQYRRYKWDFYRTLATGKRQQQGSLFTEVQFNRVTRNANINGKTSSLWDITSRSEIKARSSERINNSFVRLDVGSGSQRLHDFAPETSSNTSITASLDQLFKPTTWTINAGGFKVKDHVSSVNNRYGRWEFKARPGIQQSWVVKPGVRASNSTGSFYLKYSQTVDYNFSNHGTGIVTISVPDR